MAERPHYWMSSRTLTERLKYLEGYEAAKHSDVPEELRERITEIATELLLREIEGWG